MKAALGPCTQLAGLNEDLMTPDSVVPFSVHLQFPTDHSNAPYLEGTHCAWDLFLWTQIRCWRARAGVLLHGVMQGMRAGCVAPTQNCPEIASINLAPLLMVCASVLMLVPQGRRKGIKTRDCATCPNQASELQPEELNSVSPLRLARRLLISLPQPLLLVSHIHRENPRHCPCSNRAI